MLMTCWVVRVAVRVERLVVQAKLEAAKPTMEAEQTLLSLISISEGYTISTLPPAGIGFFP